MSYEPNWQTCSDDTDVIEKKNELDFTKLKYCLRCAVLDGWVLSKVSSIIYKIEEFLFFLKNLDKHTHWLKYI